MIQDSNEDGSSGSEEASDVESEAGSDSESPPVRCRMIQSYPTKNHPVITVPFLTGKNGHRWSITLRPLAQMAETNVLTDIPIYIINKIVVFTGVVSLTMSC